MENASIMRGGKVSGKISPLEVLVLNFIIEAFQMPLLEDGSLCTNSKDPIVISEYVA